MILLSTIGFASNGFGVFMCFRMGSFRQSFCQLYVNVAISDCGVLANFAFYVAPMIMSQSDVANYRISLAVSGFYHLFMWCVSVFSTLSLAINRLIAATYPLEYRQIYTNKAIKLNIVLLYVGSLVYAVWFLLPGCEFRMNPVYGVFSYTESQCGGILDVICSIVCCVVFLIIFILNVMSVVRMRNRNSQVGNSCDSNVAKKRKRQERGFLLQSCINSGLFQSFTLGFHAFSRMEATFFIKFLMKTILWQLAHMVNGFVFLALNEEIRREIKTIVTGVPRQPASTLAFSAGNPPALQLSQTARATPLV